MKAVRNAIFRGVNPYDGYEFQESLIDYQGWGSDHPILTTIIDSLLPSLIIEVGSWKGLSAIYMANHAKALKLDTEILCIDTWLGSPEHWSAPLDQADYFDSLCIKNGRPDLYHVFINNILAQDCSSIVTPLPLDSTSAYILLKKLSIKSQFIYIDAGHEYETVKTDINNYWELLTEDGCIVLDDFNAWPGVTRAVMEFCLDKSIVPLYDNRKSVIFKRKPVGFSNLISYSP